MKNQQGKKAKIQSYTIKIQFINSRKYAYFDELTGSKLFEDEYFEIMRKPGI